MNKFFVLIILFSSSLAFSYRQEKFDLAKSIERGKEIYFAQCVTCHLPKGEGIPTVYPPLAKSDFLTNQPEKSILFILNGASESITVNGIDYAGEMPNLNLSDEQVSDIINFIQNSWENKGEPIKPDQISAIRERGK